MIRSSVKYALLLLPLLFFTGVSAQQYAHNGRQTSRHFSVIDYGSNAQIWTGVAGSDGYVYLGNSQDILAFNGIDWTKIGVEKKHTDKKLQSKVNQSPVRILSRASDNTIYVGRQENFGYLQYSDLGLMEYVPVYASNDDESIGSIWNIFEADNNEMLFIAENCYFRYKDKQVSKISLPTGFEGLTGKTSCRFGHGLLLVYHNSLSGEARIQKYLYIDLISGKAKEIQLPEHIDLKNIRGSFEINGTWYVLDLNHRFFSARVRNGIFTWNAPSEVIFPELLDFAPNYIARYKNHIYYGTEDDGLIMADLNGHIIRRFDYYDELENLYVNYFFLDADENLWLCLDNGIQFIELSSPITYFKKKEGVSSLTEAIDFNSGKLIIALHTGIYSLKTTNTHTNFEAVSDLRQLVFDVETFNTSQGKKTLVIGNDGLYAFNPVSDTAYPISPVYAFAFCQDPANSDVVYLSLENGIGKLTLQRDGKWKYEDLVTNLEGSTLSIAILDDKVYFGIANTGVGVYNIRTKKFSIIRDNLRKNAVSKDNADLNGRITYYVELFQGRIFVGGSGGLAYVAPGDKKLSAFEGNNRFFRRGKNGFHRLINIGDKQLWVVNYIDIDGSRFDIETGWLEKQNGRWEFVKWPLGGLKKAGIISSIRKSPDGDIWVGANSGLYVIDSDMLMNYRKPLTISIDRFDVNDKTVRYNLSHSKKLDPLSYTGNSFRIVFHANTFSGMGLMEFRYKLEGFNDQWSEWTNLNFASFQKIPEGNYTIMIQARNAFGVESRIFSYEVTVLPPWYRTFWAYAIYFVLFIVLIFFIIQLSTQRVKRQNQKLEETVQERTREIAEQNTQLEHQKAEITQKTTDILDSIQYAKRIQSTILPATSRLNELFHEHFVFYRPKDIVSGDFYWAREVRGKTTFSAIDCTGHGVPGSLVSIVGNNGLLRAVNEFKLTEPREILDKLREIVVNAFRSEGQSDVKDGMDIAFCSIDYETGVLKYAGANNECVIIRNGQVFELKPDKQPIGLFVDARPFTQKEFQLEDNDCIYLYTDGYVDQFGGDKLKKFKSKPFKTMLAGLTHLPMAQQFVAVQKAFDSWKGDLEQVDDVCVFGVRYKKKTDAIRS